DAGYGAVAAGEQDAADDDGDDGVEDEGLAVGDLGSVVEDGLDHADQGGAEAAGHVQGDLDPVDGDAGGAGALLVAADGEDPVAVLHRLQHHRDHHGQAQPPEDRDLELPGDQLPEQRLGEGVRADGDAGGAGGDAGQAKGQA